MYWVFMIVSIIMILLSDIIFKRWLNMCTVYVLVWILAVSLYESNLIYYNPIKSETYLLIMIYEVAICFGIFFGRNVKLQDHSYREKKFSVDNGMETGEVKLLDKYIYITSLIGAVAIIINLFIVISVFGQHDFLNSISQIYQAREAGELEYFDYLSPIIFVSLPLVAIRIKMAGFKPYFAFVIALAASNALTFGGRNLVIVSLICFLVPFFNGKKREVKKKRKGRWKKRVAVLAMVLAFGFLFSLINTQRALATTIPNNISPTLRKWIEFNPGIYKIIQYTTEPIAYLNKFLENQYHMFGVNTFNFLYKEINHLGFDIPRLVTLPFYSVPMQCNVGTYITELQIDFGFGGILAAFLFGIISGWVHKKYQQNQTSPITTVGLCTCYVTLLLSFFMWYVRNTNLWMALLYAFIIQFFYSRDKAKLKKVQPILQRGNRI